jgi:hypothetical protein
LEKLDSFLSHAHIVQPLDAIQKELDEMKKELISIKEYVWETFCFVMHSFIENEFPLSILDDKIFDSSLTIKEYMERLSGFDIADSDRRKIESYLASKFTLSVFTYVKQRNPTHSIFSSHFFFNKLVRAILNHEIQTIFSVCGNIVMDPYLEGKLRTLRNKLLDSNTDFGRLFNLDSNSQKIVLTPRQRQFISLKLSAKYLLNRDDRLYLDFIEPWIFSLDKPYGYRMCDVLWLGFCQS